MRIVIASYARDRGIRPERNLVFVSDGFRAGVFCSRFLQRCANFASTLASTLAIAFGLGLLLAGCSITAPIASLNGDDDLSTGSIRPKRASFTDRLSVEDWRRAKSALGVALDPQGNGSPVRWDNPETQASGSFAASGSFIVKNDLVCRPFQSNLTLRGANSSPSGLACRQGPGDWVIEPEASPANPAKALQPGALF